MLSREEIFDNFAGDMEYHPRRAAVYFALAAAALAFWLFSPEESKFTTTPLVFGLGSLPLLLKGIFLLRKSSEGIGLTDGEMAELTDAARRKKLPAQAAQVLQDFGAGPLLLWPILNVGKDIDEAWTDPPRRFVFLSGVVLFGLGWVIRRLCLRG